MRAALVLTLIVLIVAVNSGKSFKRKNSAALRLPKLVKTKQKISAIKNGVRNKFKSKIAKIKGFFAGIKNKFGNIKRKLGKREADPDFQKIKDKYENVKLKIAQKVQTKLNKIKSFFANLGNKLKGKF